MSLEVLLERPPRVGSAPAVADALPPAGFLGERGLGRRHRERDARLRADDERLHAGRQLVAEVGDVRRGPEEAKDSRGAVADVPRVLDPSRSAASRSATMVRRSA